LVSNLTGEPADGDITTASYWVRHVRHPVRFADGVRALADVGAEVFLEIGPQATLLGMATASLDRQDPVLCLPSLRQGREDWQVLLGSLAQLHVRGVPIDWTAFDAPYPYRKVALPTYPFQRQRYWVTGRMARPAAAVHPWLGRATDADPGRKMVFSSEVNTHAFPYLADHRVAGRVVVPAAAWLELAQAAAGQWFGPGRHAVTHVSIPQPLVLEPGDTVVLQTVLSLVTSTRVSCTIRGRAEDEVLDTAWRTYAVATLSPDEGNGAAWDMLPDMVPFDVEEVYRALRQVDIVHGEAFRGLLEIGRGATGVVGEVGLPPGTETLGYRWHPVLLDAMLQVAAGYPGSRLMLPFAIGRFTCEAQPPHRLHVSVRAGSALEGAVTFDVQAVDDDGREVACIEGVQCREVDRAGLLRLTRGATEDWLYVVDWASAGEAPTTSLSSCLVLGDGGGLGRRLAESLRQNRVQVETRDGLGNIESLASRVVVLWALDEAGCTAGSQRTLFSQLLSLVPAMAAAKMPPSVLFVTRRAQSVEGEDVEVGQAPLWGWVRTAALEFPRLSCRLVDVDQEASSEAALLREIQSDGPESQVALRHGARYVARLQRTGFPASRPAIRADGSYLVIGGLGALGRELVAWLAAEGAGRVVVTSRSASAGAVPGCEVRSLDVGQAGALEQVCAELAKASPPLRGVFYLAGKVDDGLLAQQGWERYADVLAAKMDGAWLLHEATRTMALDFFVLFSSSTAVFGNPGQSSYAAANAFLDGLALHRRAAGLPAVCLHWGPWAVGMYERLTDRQKQRQSQAGVRPVSVVAGLGMLGDLLGAQGSVTVLKMNWRALWGRVDPRKALFLERLQPSHAAGAVERNGAVSVRDAVRQSLAKVLALSADQVDWRQPFRSIGVDSLMAVELSETLNHLFGLSLPATIIFEHGNADALVAYVERQVDLVRGSAPAISSRPPADVRQWTLNEVARVLALPPEQVPADVPLRELGLDSLMAVELSTRLEQLLGQSVAPTAAFEYPTAAALASYLERLAREAPAVEVAAVATQDNVQSTIRQRVAKIVGVATDEVGLEQPFRDLGLDSLMAVELTEGLNAVFDDMLPATVVFEYPTVRQLAEHVLARQTPAAPAALSR
jgi:acyl carrier protein/NAD(P)-dependent dehydrogenase (short-subunit alcohol dehydrogenase family)